jgi:hypothetical protein
MAKETQNQDRDAGPHTDQYAGSATRFTASDSDPNAAGSNAWT